MRLNDTRAITPAKNSVKKKPYAYAVWPAPVSMIAAQSAARTDAISNVVAERDRVRTPRLLVLVRTSVAFSFCFARAICSSIVSRRRTTGRPLLPHPVRTGGASGSPGDGNFWAGSNRPAPGRVQRPPWTVITVHALTVVATRL
ncbi:hypothetical protein [Micromonospora lupini]|uniref:hypothetical protein n=1 Tax=Micromonospora lupini TaxID=285679 RepID=UPI001ED99F07|nr:hypothetical protein [Micromonospora lupini]